MVRRLCGVYPMKDPVSESEKNHDDENIKREEEFNIPLENDFDDFYVVPKSLSPEGIQRMVDDIFGVNKTTIKIDQKIANLSLSYMAMVGDFNIPLDDVNKTARCIATAVFSAVTAKKLEEKYVGMAKAVELTPEMIKNADVLIDRRKS